MGSQTGGVKEGAHFVRLSNTLFQKLK